MMTTIRERRKRRSFAKKDRGGRPSWVMTDEQRGFIQALAMFGFGVERIAKSLGVGGNTLRRHPEAMAVINSARDKLMAGAMTCVARNIAAGNLAAAKFVVQCHGKKYGWRLNEVVAVTPPPVFVGEPGRVVDPRDPNFDMGDSQKPILDLTAPGRSPREAVAWYAAYLEHQQGGPPPPPRHPEKSR